MKPFRRIFFLPALFAFLTALPPLTPALLQGNRIVRVEGVPPALDFDMDEAVPYSYFGIALGTNQPANLSEMSYLSFWMKLEGETTGQAVDFFVELHEDTQPDGRFILGPDVSSRVPVARLTMAASEKQWKKIVIPLHQFRGVRNRDRILEAAFVFESRRGPAKGRVLVDRILFGSNYPEGLEGKEISMQNRVSSFKIDRRLASPEMKLKRRPNPLALTLTFIDPYLEEIGFEESRDEGRTWQRVHTFYNHTEGGIYSVDWDRGRAPKTGKGVLLRAVALNVLGGEAELAGPYRIRFN